MTGNSLEEKEVVAVNSGKILVTGFDPCIGEPRNPSIGLARMLAKMYPSLVVAAEVPTSYGRVMYSFGEQMRMVQPAAVLMLGVADQKQLSLERQARNACGDRPDNDGQVGPTPIIKHPDLGRECYESTLSVEQLSAALKEAGIDHECSECAGEYLCNYLMYMVLALYRNPLAGFVHVPKAREGFDPLDPGGDVFKGLCVIVEVTRKVLLTRA